MVLTPEGAQKGMPENAINYDGPIDLIGSPGQIASAILRATGMPGPLKPVSAAVTL
jgi:hypothetical protein